MSKSGRQRGALPILIASQKEFSYFLLWTCFPFFSFFYQRLSSAFDFSTCKQLFHEQRASTCEFCKVRNLNKILKKNIKNEPRQEWLPRKFPQGTPLCSRLWHLPSLLTISNSSPVRRTFIFLGSRCTQPLTPRNAHALRYEFSKWRTSQRGK